MKKYSVLILFFLCSALAFGYYPQLALALSVDDSGDRAVMEAQMRLRAALSMRDLLKQYVTGTQYCSDLGLYYDIQAHSSNMGAAVNPSICKKEFDPGALPHAVQEPPQCSLGERLSWGTYEIDISTDDTREVYQELSNTPVMVEVSGWHCVPDRIKPQTTGTDAPASAVENTQRSFIYARFSATYDIPLIRTVDACQLADIGTRQGKRLSDGRIYTAAPPSDSGLKATSLRTLIQDLLREYNSKDEISFDTTINDIVFENGIFVRYLPVDYLPASHSCALTELPPVTPFYPLEPEPKLKEPSVTVPAPVTPTFIIVSATVPISKTAPETESNPKPKPKPFEEVTVTVLAPVELIDDDGEPLPFYCEGMTETLESVVELFDGRRYRARSYGGAIAMSKRISGSKMDELLDIFDEYNGVDGNIAVIFKNKVTVFRNNGTMLDIIPGQEPVEISCAE